MYTEGTLFDGRYLLKERKGRGSFGEVWLAEDTEIGVDFAIKIYVAMDQKGLEEFRKEYQLSCNLINSNLLHINKMEVCREDGCPYLVMPYCPRGATSLVGKMSEAEMWHFLHNIANGLAYLHEQTPPIIHQDIKPDNILQMQSGDYVITDFGISKQLRGTRRSAGGDSSGAVAYMGPERFRAGYTSIKSSDIWSLGATLYEMATGQLPFEGRGGKMQDMGFETPNLPQAFSDELNGAMLACMNPEPWDRPSARQLADYASEMMKGRNVQPPFTIPATQGVPQGQNAPQPQSEPVYQTPANEKVKIGSGSPSTGGNKNMIMIVGAAAAVLVIAVLAFIFMGSGKSTTESPVDDAEGVQSTSTSITASVPTAQSVEADAEPVVVETPVQETPAPVVETPAPVAQAPQSATQKVETPTNNSGASATTESTPKKEQAKSGSGTMKLSYGQYTGATKGGYPHGKGKLVYTTSRQINKYDSKARMAEAGDYVEGIFTNGFFTTGKHYNADGELIESITVGVAEGVYESK